MQQLSDDRLIAYLDGELETAQRREVEAWLDADSAARQRMAALAQVNPEPNAVRINKSPRCNRPSDSASSSANESVQGTTAVPMMHAGNRLT